QGMVCHQTYQNAAGEWLFPEEVGFAADGRAFDMTMGETGRDPPTDDAGGLVDPTGHWVTVGRTEKMSKSKKNVVGLDAIVDTYGADTARLYLLSDRPPARALDWTETGIEGAS